MRPRVPYAVHPARPPYALFSSKEEAFIAAYDAAVAESWTRLGIVEVLAAGPRAMERRDHALDMFTAIVKPGLEHAPDTDPVVFETIGGAVFTLMFDHIRRGGAHRLPELLPVASLIALAPFIGTDAAVAIANGRTRPR